MDHALGLRESGNSQVATQFHHLRLKQCVRRSVQANDAPKLGVHPPFLDAGQGEDACARDAGR